MKIRVIWPGKTKKSYYREAIADYAARIRKITPFEIIEVREEVTTDRRSSHRVKKESLSLQQKARSPVTVILEINGADMNSVDFARWLSKQTDDIDFLLGGPHGMEAKGKSLKLSMGKMTMPHELARVVLLEQIYRSLTIIKGFPYHK